MKNKLRSKSHNTLQKKYSTNNLIQIFDKIEEEKNKEILKEEEQKKYILNVRKLSNNK